MNFEQYEFVSKIIRDENNNITIWKMNLTRFIFMLFVFTPVLFLEDEYYLSIMIGGFLGPLVGLVFPVSLKGSFKSDLQF